MYMKSLLYCSLFLNSTLSFSSEQFGLPLKDWFVRNSLAGQWVDFLSDLDDRHLSVSGNATDGKVDISFYDCLPNGTAAKILSGALMSCQSISCVKEQSEELSKRDETPVKTYRKAPSTAFKRKSSQNDDHHFSDYSLLPVKKVPCFFEQGPPISSDFMRKVFSKKYINTMVDFFSMIHQKKCTSEVEAFFLFTVTYDYLAVSFKGSIKKEKNLLDAVELSLMKNSIPKNGFEGFFTEKSFLWMFQYKATPIGVAAIIASYLYNIDYPFSLEEQDKDLYGKLKKFNEDTTRVKLNSFFVEQLKVVAEKLA